jgi:hypothetical protein
MQHLISTTHTSRTACGNSYVSEVVPRFSTLTSWNGYMELGISSTSDCMW